MAIYLPAQNTDDCHVGVETIWLLTDYLGIGNFGGNYYDTGVRFRNVTIPQGRTVLTAKVTFQCYQAQAGTNCNIQIKGEAADDTATFLMLADYIARARTDSFVNWDAIPAWVINTDYDSPDLSGIIQEIVNRPGWVSGNNLVLFFANNASDVDAYRVPKAYDLTTTLCARLIVTYFEGLLVHHGMSGGMRELDGGIRG